MKTMKEPCEPGRSEPITVQQVREKLRELSQAALEENDIDAADAITSCLSFLPGGIPPAPAPLGIELIREGDTSFRPAGGQSVEVTFGNPWRSAFCIAGLLVLIYILCFHGSQLLEHAERLDALEQTIGE